MVQFIVGVIFFLIILGKMEGKGSVLTFLGLAIVCSFFIHPALFIFLVITGVIVLMVWFARQ